MSATVNIISLIVLVFSKELGMDGSYLSIHNSYCLY
jgi:hypothetical protein